MQELMNGAGISGLGEEEERQRAFHRSDINKQNLQILFTCKICIKRTLPNNKVIHGYIFKIFA